MENEIGKRLKQIRLKRNLSLRALAKLAHLSHSFIADIEAGRSKPSLDTLQVLARALNVSYEDLLPSRTKRKEVPPDKLTLQEKSLAEALLRLSEIFYEYDLPDNVKYQLFKEAITKYGPPGKTKKDDSKKKDG